jgi:hypothetical protein
VINDVVNDDVMDEETPVVMISIDINADDREVGFV